MVFLHLVKVEKSYMTRFVNEFNLLTINGLMCRHLISVDWQGNPFDCDFNQILELPLNEKMPQTIFDFDTEKVARWQITTNAHYFGYPAALGSSGGGAVTS